MIRDLIKLIKIAFSPCYDFKKEKKMRLTNTISPEEFLLSCDMKNFRLFYVGTESSVFEKEIRKQSIVYVGPKPRKYRYYFITARELYETLAKMQLVVNEFEIVPGSYDIYNMTGYWMGSVRCINESNYQMLIKETAAHNFARKIIAKTYS